MQTRITRELNYDAQETFDQNIFILIYNEKKGSERFTSERRFVAC